MDTDIRGLPRLMCPLTKEGEEVGSEHIASNITELIGWTPLIELKNIMKKDGIDARLVGKLEFYQPLSSLKERSALRLIEDAEEKGLIIPGVTTLIEYTSGNLGIGLMVVAAQKGYKFIAVTPAKYSLEKQMLLKYLGAEVVLCDPSTGFEGILKKTEEVKEKTPNSHILSQASNPANPHAHFAGTGPEIWKDTGGKVDILVCGSGSGGTITGTSRYLKSKNPSLKVIAVEPSESPAISDALKVNLPIQGGSRGKHYIQGIGPGIIPDCLDISLIDDVITVSSEEAVDHARRLAREEGVLAGISSGAALAASIKAARREENKGKMIVTIFPSGGERYLNTQLFSDVREECMNMTF